MRDEKRFGKYALVHYKGKVLDGDVIEDYSEGEPQRIHLGYDLVPRGMDKVLFELEKGESCTAIIPPEEAYGYPDPAGIQIVMRSKVPDGETLDVGSQLAWRSPITRKLLPVRVVEATKDYLKLDYNHPLAGKTLEYWFEMVDIVDE